MHSISRIAGTFVMAGLCVVGVAQAQTVEYKRNGKVLLPDPNVTPGHKADITQARVCATKWGQDERAVSAAMKKAVYTKYGLTDDSGICKKKLLHPDAKVKRGCEIDHLISRELGGADTEDNLWPQPYTQKPGAYQKDTLENWLHKQVCKAKTMSLEKAQKLIQEDWYKAYKENYMKNDPN